MRSLLGIFAVAALSLWFAACGGATKGTDSRKRAETAAGTSTAVTSNFSTHNNDRDNDGDHNDDDHGVLYYGWPANAADHRISVSLVTRYFAAAAAENGATACALLVPFVAEAVPENDGHTARLRGRTCTVVMSKLFKLHHPLLVKKKASLKVIGVRVEGDKALVILEFPAIPEVRQITERRVGSTWRLLDLLDGILE